jgi:hypothetical protein
MLGKYKCPNGLLHIQFWIYCHTHKWRGLSTLLHKYLGWHSSSVQYIFAPCCWVYQDVSVNLSCFLHQSWFLIKLTMKFIYGFFITDLKLCQQMLLGNVRVLPNSVKVPSIHKIKILCLKPPSWLLLRLIKSKRIFFYTLRHTYFTIWMGYLMFHDTFITLKYLIAGNLMCHRSRN